MSHGEGNVLKDQVYCERLGASPLNSVECVFSKLTLTEIMRQLRREADLRDFLATHFHAPFSIG
jgi:hypothetical protein